MVHFDPPAHFGRSDRNVPFHLTKLLSPVPFFCIQLTRTITKRAVARVGSVQPECTVPLGTLNFPNFKPKSEPEVVEDIIYALRCVPIRQRLKGKPISYELHFLQKEEEPGSIPGHETLSFL